VLLAGATVRKVFFYMAFCSALLAALPLTAAAQGRMGARIQRMLSQSDQPPAAPAPPDVDGLGPWLKQFHELVPQSAADYADFNPDELAAAATAVEQWCAVWESVAVGLSPDGQLGVVGRLHDVKQSIDRQLDNVLSLRVQFAALPADAKRHEALRHYLRTTSILVDLSGRLRSVLLDVVDAAADRVSNQTSLRERFIDLLTEKHSSAGAQIMSVDLFKLQPQAADANAPPPLSAPLKLKVIHLITESGTIDEVDELADFLLNAATPPTQVLAAAEAIRILGLPQDPRPEQDASLPQPPITAAKMRDRLQEIDTAQWKPDELPRLNSLLAWLSTRIEHGLEGDTYRLGNFDVRPGDWLLMRNPSPYNLFTDLSPGLFTHVGVVTIETGSDGKRRMVVVDLPERGTTMPATNVETFLDRTLNYVFVRHPDPAVARKMGEAAAAMIGNPTQFDLNFRTDRIAALKGKPLHGEKIHTYCAGLLLLCTQDTGLPREEFFPITETTAGGHTQENLAKLGLSLGDGFVSPTGALFSPHLDIVGRCEPMYDAPREVQEAIYDHFATRLENSQLQPSPDAYQSLRQKVAEASKNNPLLAKALAATAGVSEEMDLISAAKAAAVVETLDEIAYGASDEYLAATRAIFEGGSLTPEQQRQLTPQQREALEKYRNSHSQLAAGWDQGLLSPRAVRIELVKFYKDLGFHQLDDRFFRGEN
jgi:hypothetical protein